MVREAVVRGLWALAAAACCLACVNIVVLFIVPSYDFHLGPLHLFAHQRFKPFLLLGAAFGVAIFLRGLIPQQPAQIEPFNRSTSFAAAAIVLAVYAAVYFPSAAINPSDPGWIVSYVVAPLRSLPSAVFSLFTSPQADGFYRPLTLLSLWADYRWFGSTLWAYHPEGILLHVLNAALVYQLARELKLEPTAAFWSAAWFLLAAANFEPILWPGARFDLIATAFVLVSLIFFLRYLRSPGRAMRELSIAAASFALGIFNKESAYCVPLLLAVLVLTKREWQVDSIDRAKLWRSAALFAGITMLMLAIRIAIYHGLGGAQPIVEGGASPNFSITVKSFLGIITRVIPLPMLGLNLSVPLSAAMAGFVILYLGAIAWAVVRGASMDGPQRTLVCLALLAALPAINLIGWVNPAMQHSRYLYLPGLFMLIAAASAINRVPHGNIALAAIVAANLAGCVHNLDVYRTLLAKADSISQQIAGDPGKYHATSVDLSAIDPAPFGVLFFRSEIVDRLQHAQPNLCISIAADSCQPGHPALRYNWLPESASVTLRDPTEPSPSPPAPRPTPAP